MKKKMRKLLSGLLLVAMLAFLGLTAWQAWGYYQGEKAAQRARTLAGADPQVVITTPVAPETTVPSATAPAETQAPNAVTAPPVTPLEARALFLLEVDLKPLQEVNPEVMGWICIPDTKISYPLMRGEDNQKYLTRAWDGTRSSAGSIFLEQTNDPWFLDFNTIIYGHNMANGTAFGQLRKYREQDFWQAHRYIYIVTENDIRRYQIFSAYEAPIDSDTYRLNFSTNGKKQAALDGYIQNSLWEAEAVPDLSSQILTLSTCTGTGSYEARFVVQGMLTGIWKR